jgi:hypothetical protein
MNELHKRKVSFWPQYRDALEKQNKKIIKAEEKSNLEL